MGWFDEQIKLRKENDDNAFADSFVNMAGAVMGKRVSAALKDDRVVTKDAIDEIMKFYHVKSREVPDSITDMNEQLEYLMRPYGIARRTVILEKGWYKDAIGAMLTIRKDDNSVVALIPGSISGYVYYDINTNKYLKVNKKNEELFEDEAIAFYKPFPLKALSIKDLVKYIFEALSFSDYLAIVLMTLILSLLGMLTPKINNILFSTVVGSGSLRLLLGIAIFTICFSIC